jgi:MFS family permease
MASATYQQLLRRNVNFRHLWAGQVISELGSWFSFIAELGLVRMLSGTSLATTILLVSRLLPFLVVAPFAGVIADRYSRKHIMIASDVFRALAALGYLIVGTRGPVWMVFVCSALLSSFGTFFEAAKNGALPNLVTGHELLTANVLMFSTRFLQFTLGSALGGLTAARFGYDVAFIVNSISFVASASFVALIPGGLMRRNRAGSAVASDSIVEPQTSPASVDGPEGLPVAGSEQPATITASFWNDVRGGLAYIWATPFVRGLILVNIFWATGGGMSNLIFDQLGGHVFARGGGDRGDWGVALLYSAGGAGLSIGMMLARRAGAWVKDERRAGHFIGWMLLVHGLLFALAGVMPTLTGMALLIVASRFLLGMEFGVQETLVMRVLPDEYRGRVFTTDRALELTTMMLSMIAGGWLLRWSGPRGLMVLAGLLAATPGCGWLLAIAFRRIAVPAHAVRESFG